MDLAFQSELYFGSRYIHVDQMFFYRYDMQNSFFSWIDHRTAAQRQHAEIARLTGVGNGRMLEFFSGDGAYLSYFQEKNWECLGLETDESLVDVSMMTHAVPTLSGDPIEVTLPNNSYDIVRIRGGLNHYANPKRLLEIAFYATAFTGYLIVEVWNKNGSPCNSTTLPNTFNRKQLNELVKSVNYDVGGIFAPAVGDSIWCPLHLQTKPPAFPIRCMDSVCGFFDNGSLLVLLAQKPPKDKV